MIAQSQGWPELEGKVVNAAVAGWAHVEITYQYLVGDRFYIGRHNINLSPVMVDKTGSAAADLNKEARRLIDDYLPGARVTIRYNPERPEESILIKS